MVFCSFFSLDVAKVHGCPKYADVLSDTVFDQRETICHFLTIAKQVLMIRK